MLVYYESAVHREGAWGGGSLSELNDYKVHPNIK